jgi:hypothetical protein
MVLSLYVHSAPCIAIQRGAKIGGALPQPFVDLADGTRMMWCAFKVGISHHRQHFGNCLGLAIPARRMNHCLVPLPRYFPRGGKGDFATPDTLNSAFRQNFDNISPV